MTDEFVKIVFELPSSNDAAAEVMWGRPLGGNTFELRSVPVWAYGLAYEDVVEALPGEDGRRYFSKIMRKSGLLTVRIAGPAADRNLFETFVDLFRPPKAVAAENYSPSYWSFAMEQSAFSELSAEIQHAEKSGSIFVEVANDADP